MNKRFLYDFSKANLLEKLTNEIADQETDIAVLKSVERLHKKDGSDFANVLKNFTNLYHHNMDAWWFEARNTVRGRWHDVTIYANKGDSPDDIWNNIQNSIAHKEADLEVRRELRAEIENDRCGIVKDLETIRDKVEALGEYKNKEPIDKTLYYLLYEYLT